MAGSKKGARGLTVAGTVQGNRFVSCRTAEEISSIKATTWRKWVGERRVTHLKLGRAVRIPLSEIERVIAEATVPAIERRTA